MADLESGWRTIDRRHRTGEQTSRRSRARALHRVPGRDVQGRQALGVRERRLSRRDGDRLVPLGRATGRQVQSYAAHRRLHRRAVPERALRRVRPPLDVPLVRGQRERGPEPSLADHPSARGRRERRASTVCTRAPTGTRSSSAAARTRRAAADERLGQRVRRERCRHEILQAIKLARADGGGNDQRLGLARTTRRRFGSRWRIVATAVHGRAALTPSSRLGSATAPMRVRRRVRTRSAQSAGLRTAEVAAETEHWVGCPVSMTRTEATVAGGIPHYRRVGGDESTRGCSQLGSRTIPMYPEGVVLLNVEHPVPARADRALAGAVPRPLLRTRSRQRDRRVRRDRRREDRPLRAPQGHDPVEDVEEQLRSEDALTMALLGLIAEEAMIAPRIGGKFRKKPGEH